MVCIKYACYLTACLLLIADIYFSLARFHLLVLFIGRFAYTLTAERPQLALALCTYFIIIITANI